VRRSSIFSIVVVVAVVALAGAYIVGNFKVAIPASAGTTSVARTTLEGAPTPDPSEITDPNDLTPSPAGQACLARILRPEGWLDLCWEATREMAAGSPTQDYYRLRVYGTYSGESGTGVRWTVVRAKLLRSPSDGALKGWPDGPYEGACQQQPVSLPISHGEQEMICGLTTGDLRTSDWTYTVTWTCVGCVLPDRSSRGLVLDEFIAVREGSVPNWEIFADVGS
jgi:hypothetical protein